MRLVIKDKRAGAALFLLCFAAYCSSYFGRLNFSAALSAIVSGGVLDKAAAGLIGTVFFAVYGAGQLVNGFLGDRFSPFAMVSAGLFFSAAANAAMGLVAPLWAMVLVWGVNGFAQSMLWTPILRILSRVLPEEQRGKALLHMAMTVPLGTLGAYGISYLALRFFSWQAAFFAPGALILAVLAGWTVFSARIKKHLVPEEAEEEAAAAPRQKGGLAGLLASSGAVAVLAAVAVHAMLKDGVMTWVPTMITEVFGTEASFSVLLSMALPVVNLGGAYAAQLLIKKLKTHEIKVAALIFLFCAPPVAALLFLGRLPVAAALACLAAVTASMFAVNYLLITLAPVRFARFDKVSGAGGVFNASAYAGSALSTYGFGLVSERLGWGWTVAFWLVLIAAALAALALSFKKWRGFIE